MLILCLAVMLALLARRLHPLRLRQPHLLDYNFCMSGIALVHNAITRPRYQPVQHPHVLHAVMLVLRPQQLGLDLVLLLELALQPSEVVQRSGGSKIVPVHGDHYLSLLACEAEVAWRCLAPAKANRDQKSGVGFLPILCGISGAVQALP